MMCTLIVYVSPDDGPVSYDLLPNDRISQEMSCRLERLDGDREAENSGCQLRELMKTISDLSVLSSQYDISLPQGCTISRVITYYE